MLLAGIPACPHGGDIMDYSSGVEGFTGQQPFLSDSMAPAVPEEPHVIMYTSGTTGNPKVRCFPIAKRFSTA